MITELTHSISFVVLVICPWRVVAPASEMSLQTRYILHLFLAEMTHHIASDIVSGFHGLAPPFTFRHSWVHLGFFLRLVDVQIHGMYVRKSLPFVGGDPMQQGSSDEGEHNSWSQSIPFAKAQQHLCLPMSKRSEVET